MKKGDRVRCVDPRNALTRWHVYTVLDTRLSFGRDNMVFVENDEGRQAEYYARRFRPVDTGIEFTDEEYESLLV